MDVQYTYSVLPIPPVFAWLRTSDKALGFNILLYTSINVRLLHQSFQRKRSSLATLQPEKKCHVMAMTFLPLPDYTDVMCRWEKSLQK